MFVLSVCLFFFALCEKADNFLQYFLPQKVCVTIRSKYVIMGLKTALFERV